jgi:hypothetical protein
LIGHSAMVAPSPPSIGSRGARALEIDADDGR